MGLRVILKLSALALLLSACAGESGEQPAACAPENCPGCCLNGQCMLGNQSVACGTRGGLCVSCSTSQSCQAGQCVSTGTGTCAPGNCAGCCFYGKCEAGNTRSACGQNGFPCAQCSGSQQCINGVCQASGGANPCNPQTCATGCCLGAECRTQLDRNTCGRAGSPCVRCGSNQQCVGGQCVESNCLNCAAANGCCLNNVCYPGNHATACGSAGQACQVCNASQVCQGGRCVDQAIASDCSYKNCPIGCCTAQGCQFFYSDQYCGVAGIACRACASWQKCQLGFCVNEDKDCSANCDGCCDGGNCIAAASQTDVRCGSGGSTCQACPYDHICDTALGRCVPKLSACATCTGCCDPAAGRCRALGTSDQNTDYCGTGGALCQPCKPGMQCVSGVCRSTTTLCADCADGCCSPLGGCVKYNVQGYRSCGANGAECADCWVSGQICNPITHTCSAPDAGCQNCDTDECCKDGRCVPGRRMDQCGSFGAACLDCKQKPGTYCTSIGACGATPGQCGDCGPTQCCGPGGCVEGTVDKSCGLDGTACRDCTRLPGDERCEASTGDCKPPAASCSPTTCTGPRCCNSAGECVAATKETCAKDGATCSDCTTRGSTYVCDSALGQCVDLGERYDVCLASITVDCSEDGGHENCQGDISGDPDLEVTLTVGTTSATSSVAQDVPPDFLDWVKADWSPPECLLQQIGATSLTSYGIKVTVRECDLWGCSEIDSCTAYPSGADLAAGSYNEELCSFYIMALDLHFKTP